MASTDLRAPPRSLTPVKRTRDGMEKISTALPSAVEHTNSNAPLIRPPQSLTYELANHAKAYLEAKQYASGFAFLTTLLTTGTVASTATQRYPALLAPAPQLSFAASLVAYPLVTTKASSIDKIEGADAALRYLQIVQTTISPLDKTRRKAFLFPDERTRRRNMGQRESATPGTPGRVDVLSGVAANGQSIWYRAQDFWHIVGWAFNCSAVHKKRWERWKLWLQTMLDFLEAEFEARLDLCKERAGNDVDALCESLLWHYISSETPTSSATRRRIVQAILAFGTSESMASFPEIWEDETLEPIKEQNTTDGNIDIENGELGDFAKDDEDVVMQNTSNRASTSRKPRGQQNSHDKRHVTDEELSNIETISAAIEHLGGTEAIGLRRRLITLLARVAQHLPDQFAKLGELNDTLTREIIHLPIMLFSPVVSILTLPGALQMALNANLLLPLTSEQLPDYTVIEPVQMHLEQFLLPLRASTESFAANAKISVVLEQMFMHMMTIRALKATDTLRDAVQNGCEARGNVYGSAKGKKGNAVEEQHARLLLQAFRERLLGLLEILEMSQGKPPQPPQEDKSRSLSFISEISELSSEETSEDELAV